LIAETPDAALRAQLACELRDDIARFREFTGLRFEDWTI
jgi:hypothetical protein